MCIGQAKAAMESKESQSKTPDGRPGGGDRVKAATDTHTPRGKKTEPKGFSYSRELQNKGMKTEVVDQKQGIVSVSGEGYKYNDQAAGITTIYPTRTDGISDGLKGSDLEKVNLSESKYIDLSNFNEKNPNPHNAAATREAKRLGYPSNHAHVTAASSPDRVKNFLTISEKDHQKSGIDGVIVKRYGNSGGVQSKDRVIRLYTKKS